MAEWTQESLEERRRELANPIKLYLASGEEAGIWLCAHDRHVHPHEQGARECYTCSPTKCDDCGKLSEPRRPFRLCEECHAVARAAAEQREMDGAEQIAAEDWTGGVVHEGRFFESVDAMLCVLLDDEVPSRVWATTRHHPDLSADRVVEDYMEECLSSVDEAFDPQPDSMDEFRAATEAWSEAQTWWWEEEDRSRVVVFEGDEAKERLEAAS